MSMTDEEFHDYILSAPTLEALDSLEGWDAYNECGRIAAKMVYEHLQEYPEDNLLKGWDLYDRVVETHPSLRSLGLTGFMWGYAMQSAEKLLNLPLQPNPALFTIAVPE